MRKKAILAAVLTFVVCVLMVMFPSLAIHSARKGIRLWTTDVMPALFPFFICANFLTSLGVISRISPSFFPFVMSFMSGYPMGAKIIGDMRRNDEITLSKSKRLISFCSVSGPAFILGSVGAGMLESNKLGVIIALAHYTGALLNGAFYGRIFDKGSGKEINQFKHKTLNDTNLQEMFTDSIFKALKSMGVILAYMVLFMLITDMLQASGILFMAKEQHTRAILKGIIEMTVGCDAVAGCSSMSDAAKCIACSFIISWSGLSVIGQSMSMLTDSGISVGYILLTKLTHGLFSVAVAFVITIFVL